MSSIENATAEEVVNEKVAVAEKSITERIDEADMLFAQSRTTRSGVKEASKIFGKKAKVFNPTFCPEERKGHLFPTVKDLYSSTYDKAIQKVVEALKAKKYNVRFLSGLKIERKVNFTSADTLQICSLAPVAGETILKFNEKCDSSTRPLGLLELLYFVLIEDVSCEKETWVICSGDNDFGVQSKFEHVPLVKIHKKEIIIWPTQANQAYKYPFGMLVEVNK